MFSQTAARERGEDVPSPEPEEAVEVPSEDEVAAERKKVEDLSAEKDRVALKMRGVEGALAFALYGLPTLSC